jgi:hypothetical protein
MTRNRYVPGNKTETQPRAYWHSRKQEKRTAKGLGGRRVSGSGNGVRKGDVQVPALARIECKTTSNISFSVTRRMIEKLENAGIANDEVPVIQIEFLPTNVVGCESNEKVAILPWHYLEALLIR